MRWHVVNRADPSGAKIADRHYNRQKVGARQFVPPGRCIVLVIPGVALWVTSWPFPEYVKHDWAGAWVNSTFRNERGREHLSSELILEAIAATRWFWPTPPHALGLVTFIDEIKVKRKRNPGRCYTRAGFHQVMTYDYGADPQTEEEAAYAEARKLADDPIRDRVPRRTWSEGLLVFQMMPDAMPPAERPLGATADLFALPLERTA